LPAILPLDDFDVLLLDMNSTFMFGEDRFGPDEDFAATYRDVGGESLPAGEVNRIIRAAFAYLDARYADPAYEDDFPSVCEALAVVAPPLRAVERALLELTFARHELGVVPPACAAALRALSTTHELRLLTNIWAPKARWLAELDRAGVLPLFRVAVFSSDTRSVKPSLRLVQLALDGIACAPRDVLMVGDSLHRDLLAGRRAGLATAWVGVEPEVPPAAAHLVDYRVPSLLALAERARGGAPEGALNRGGFGATVPHGPR
jgi:FMN phosphatase YigB (HAD superfamily)